MGGEGATGGVVVRQALALAVVLALVLVVELVLVLVLALALVLAVVLVARGWCAQTRCDCPRCLALGSQWTRLGSPRLARQCRRTLRCSGPWPQTSQA